MITDFQEEIVSRKVKLKKDIKINAGKCAKMLLVLGIMSQVLGFVIMFIIKERGRRLGLDISINEQQGYFFGISKEVYNFLMGYLPCILADIIAIIIGIKITKVKIKSDMFCKSKATKEFVILGSISCIGVGVLSSIIYAIYSFVLTFMGIIIPSPDFNFPTENIPMLILFLSYVCVIGPVLEEIIFRGYILKTMQKYGDLTAIIVSAIFFSMFHLNLVQFINPILVGILFGFITVKSKSILPTIIAHIFNNTITFIMSGVVSSEGTIKYLIANIYFIGGIIGLIFFIRKYGKEFINILREETQLLKVHEKVRTSFCGVWSIVYVIFYIIMVGGIMLITNIS